MAARPTFYVTNAIPYANGAPHIGHAYERIASDAISRFKRLDGYDVLYMSGMDEHGQKMQQTAAREGLTPLALADRTYGQFAAMTEELGVEADDVVRTTQARHRESVQAIWRRMAASGDIYLSTYSGWYSVRDEAYYEESDLSAGPGGQRLAPSGTPVEWVEEDRAISFKLSAYQRPAARALRRAAQISSRREKYRERNRRASSSRGLKDLSISRTTFSVGHPGAGRPEATSCTSGSTHSPTT